MSRRWRRRILLVSIAGILLAYPAWLGFQIWTQSRVDELHSADAIVVLGAAQYNGRPSPVLQARLDHAAYLYDEGFAGTVIVTGGKQPGDEFTEAEAGKIYLEEHHVDADDILVEARGETTFESLRGVRRLAQDNAIETVLLVSDPLHSERVKRMAEDLGFRRIYASPASYLELERSRATKAKELVREVFSLMAYEWLGT